MSNDDSDRIQMMIDEKRIKLHLFEPSQRKIWTVVGKGEEHWIEPDLNYCSCPGYYFAKLNGKNTCYHLESAKAAIRSNSFEQIVFSDEEFSDFIFGVVSDL